MGLVLVHGDGHQRKGALTHGGLGARGDHSTLGVLSFRFLVIFLMIWDHPISALALVVPLSAVTTQAEPPAAIALVAPLSAVGTLDGVRPLALPILAIL